MISQTASPQPHGHHALAIALLAGAILTKGQLEQLILALTAVPVIAPYVERLTPRR
ncbi:hypothetical protein [Streptomyces nigrescens]|uniref:hypothetical protein n=1 Tax=Streptomyces nigrescens TaxID=1920 RepID=UPI00369A2523